MKTWTSFWCCIGILFFPFGAYAQYMNVHAGETHYQVDMMSIDSLTFTETPLDSITDVSVDVNSQRIDGGGSLWILEVSAIVVTGNSRPAEDGVLVQFSVDPGIAVVTADAYTGNASADGHRFPGIAYGLLAYSVTNTNERISLQATVIGASGNEITDTIESFRLPIQQPSIQINVDRFNYFYADSEDYAAVCVDAYVYDSRLSPINNQLVRFLGTRGAYHYSHGRGSDVTYEMLSGDIGEYVDIEDGCARRYLLVLFQEAFPDPMNLEAQARVTACLPSLGLYSEELIIDLVHE